MRIILANGCWDPLHYGHVLHLRAALKMGDRLVVSVTSDAHVNKGPNKPIQSAELRCDMLRELRCVNEVLIVDDPAQALESVRPNVFVKGSDYAGKIRPQDEAICRRLNIKIVLTDTPKWSSWDLVRAGL